MSDALTLVSAVAVIGAAVFVALRAWSSRGTGDFPIGSISERWLAEHRLNRPDSQH